MDREKFRQKALKQTKQKKSKSAEFLMGNECSRNYFDPLMDEEINPRQCGMEVSREVDDRILYKQLMELLHESGRGKLQDESIKAETADYEGAMSSSKSHEFHKEAKEATPSYIEEFERFAHKDIMLLGSTSLEQDRALDMKEARG